MPQKSIQRVDCVRECVKERKKCRRDRERKFLLKSLRFKTQLTQKIICFILLSTNNFLVSEVSRKFDVHKWD